MRFVACFFSLLLLAAALPAQDGKVLYETFCGACHGSDGKGANDGQFPPLAESAWVKGKPDLMLQVILHGLTGEIRVPSPNAHNALYNLVMPPQGGTLTSEQIAKIATYVRRSWGNKEGAVTVAMVEEQRKATKARNTMWEANELLERHPLPGAKKKAKQNPAIANLLSYVYHGSWSQRPDFKQLKPVSVEEEHKGLISVTHAGRKDAFGIVWEGEITAKKAGEYKFKIDSDDGSAVIVNGELVAEVKGTGAMNRGQEGKIRLDAGTHDIRIEYFEKSGGQDIALAMRGPDTGGWVPLSETGARKKGTPSIPIVPLPREAAIYRNFIEGTTPRGIGVGYHGGVNLAFSADHMAVELLWTGNFMDGGRHWTNRGQGNQPPAGTKVVKISGGPAFAALESQTTPWPAAYGEALAPVFRGYKFNAAQEPTFFYTLG
ncbi:MAG: c-type cytochrome, partial [Akkermansiaceae bacterium]|nr:c-type cytochrome [Akkermansiaceae bacterium]